MKISLIFVAFLENMNFTSFRFYLPKFLMVGTLWFAALTMALLQESNELRDPSFSYQINTAHYQNFQVKQVLESNYYPYIYLEIQEKINLNW